MLPDLHQKKIRGDNRHLSPVRILHSTDRDQYRLLAGKKLLINRILCAVFLPLLQKLLKHLVVHGKYGSLIRNQPLSCADIHQNAAALILIVCPQHKGSYVRIILYAKHHPVRTARQRNRGGKYDALICYI